ncbi:50S ribosomal protein L9 [Candidatus Peregrinibacteria bacterium]|nr:50S ribosomal protein L9 [Candidatus Peregrinibacteria bacterium]
MQVILTKNVDKLGKRGDVRDVKFGYYNNYLAPNGLAFVATPARLKWAEGLQAKAVKAKEEVAKQAEQYKKTLEDVTLTFEEKTTDKDTLYGSIGEKELIAALEDQAKISLDKKQIVMEEPIKTVGSHTVSVQLTDDVTVDISVEVKGNEE